MIASDELATAARSVRLKAWFHLFMCRHCRRYAAQIQAIAAAARRSFRKEAGDSSRLAQLEAEILGRCFEERNGSTDPHPHDPDSDETGNP